MLYPDVNEKYIDGDPNPYYKGILKSNLYYRGYAAALQDVLDELNDNDYDYGCTPSLHRIFKEIRDLYDENLRESIEVLEADMIIDLIDGMPECVHKMRMKEVYGEKYNG